jgi:hypothetical protein
MRKLLAGTAAAVAAVAGLLVMPAHAAQARPAVNWTARTCAAVTAWERHPAPGRLVTLAADSLRVPWKYLGEDAWQLYRDVRVEGPGGKYVSDDEQYLYNDCHGGYGL